MKTRLAVLERMRLRFLLPLLWAHVVLAGDVAWRKPVTNEYHGIKVVDDYQWLENGTNPAVRAWTDAQNQRTRDYLDRLAERAEVAARFQQADSAAATDYYGLQARPGRYFLLKSQPPALQPVLISLTSLTNLESEHVVLDLNKLSAAGRVAMDFYEASPDGQRVAVCLSENGSEQGSLRVYEAETGRAWPEMVPYAQYPTAGGSVAWNADGSGFFYTRYPHPGERPDADLPFYQQVYFHKLGTPVAEDRYEFGQGLPRIAEIELQASPDRQHLLAAVANGDGGEHAYYLRGPGGRWRPVAGFSDQIKKIEFGRDMPLVGFAPGGALYLLSLHKSPRGKILRLPLTETNLAKAQVIVKEGSLPIEGFAPAASGVYVHYLDGGPSAFRFVDLISGKTADVALRANPPAGALTAPSPGALQQMLVTRGDEVLFCSVTYTEPYAWYLYDPNKGQMVATALRGTSVVKFLDVEVVRVMVRSKDGTRVPLSIIRKKGTRLNGENPVILSGYGGFGLSETPSFDPTRRFWLDQGGLYAIANLRGGSEYGEDWHQGGAGTNKQHVFDDFAACAEWLIRSNYTKPSRLAIEGGSNGGLLMGAMLTQHPELVGAVISHVGIYDMLRVELDPNGVFNTTEFGSVKDPQQFKALYAYSPFHHVQDGVSYPPVFLLTGEHDGRVNPAHSRKMAARLQAAGGRGTVLLQVSAHSGHGIGTALDERRAALVDVYAFILKQLGVEWSRVDRGP
jgi:prolyl oligopeptidase